MFLLLFSRFHITINYYHVVVRYAWHSVAGFNKTWIGGKIQIKYVAFHTRDKLHLLKAKFLLHIKKLLMLHMLVRSSLYGLLLPIHVW